MYLRSYFLICQALQRSAENSLALLIAGNNDDVAHSFPIYVGTLEHAICTVLFVPVGGRVGCNSAIGAIRTYGRGGRQVQPVQIERDHRQSKRQWQKYPGPER